MLIYTAVMAFIVFLDQITKYLAVIYLNGGSVDFIPGVLRFTYTENRGAAFGMLSNHRWAFIIPSVVAIVCLSVYLFKYKPAGISARLGFSFVIAGGIGNMIDRIFLDFVIDFIDFYAFPSLWKWIFNVADSFVCIGAFILIVNYAKLIIGDIKAERSGAAKNAKKKNE